MPIPERVIGALAVLAIVVPCACGPARDGSTGRSGGGRPNILIVTIDTLRADHCSIYGYGRPTTPRLARLASEGTRIELAYAPMPTTAPSHATMFTSLYPIAHGVLKNGWPLAESHETLAEVLAANGYATGAVVSSFPLAKKFGLAQGFAHYDHEFGDGDGRVRQWEGRVVSDQFDRKADETATRAVAWLEDLDGDRPFFLWVHLYDPHTPYDPPSHLRREFPARPAPGQNPQHARDIALYDAEVRFADDAVGVVVDTVDRLGLRDSTLIVVTSDHGEGLGQHDHWLHGLFVYEEAMLVPLVFRWPGKIPAGRTLRGPVELVDLSPTLMAFARVPPRRRGQGTSIARALIGQQDLDPGRAVFMQRRLYESGKAENVSDVLGEKFGVRIGHWKYIEAKEENTRELFDLATDPGELRNLVAEHADRAGDLSGALQSWRAATRRPLPPPPGISPEDEARLRALGYVQ